MVVKFETSVLDFDPKPTDEDYKYNYKLFFISPEDKKKEKEKEKEKKSNKVVTNTTKTTYNYSSYSYSNNESDEVKEERRKYTVPGLCGLVNIGNTCYMNSIIQCLNNIPEFSVYMKQERFKNKLINRILYNIKKDGKDTKDNKLIQDKIENTVSVKLAEIFKHSYSKPYIIRPVSFKSLVGNLNEEFRGNDQHDSQELFNFVIDTIHEEIKTSAKVTVSLKKSTADVLLYQKYYLDYLLQNNISAEDKINILSDYKKYYFENMDEIVRISAIKYWKNYVRNNCSIITDLFCGLMFQYLKCNGCNQISPKFEHFNMLQLDIDDKRTTLDECLNKYFQEEELSGDNKYDCTFCDEKQVAKKGYYIWNPPEYLIIHLKRFKMNWYAANPHMTKISTVVEFPLNNLSLNDTYCSINKHNYTYDLIATSDHSGSLHGGHYITYSKNPINNKWYEYNDSNVEHIPDDKIESKLTPKAYILIYKRNKPDAKVFDIFKEDKDAEKEDKDAEKEDDNVEKEDSEKENEDADVKKVNSDSDDIIIEGINYTELESENSDNAELDTSSNENNGYNSDISNDDSSSEENFVTYYTDNGDDEEDEDILKEIDYC